MTNKITDQQAHGMFVRMKAEVERHHSLTDEENIERISGFALNFLLNEVAQLKPRNAPVQGYAQGIPWDMHLEAYNAYCKRYGAQQALIEGGCRGGFGTGELDMFIPGWREKLSLVGKLNAEIESLRKQLEELSQPKSQDETEQPASQVPEIPMNELRVSTYSPTVRSGFDHRPDSGCRITHVATRIEVSAEDERSTHKARVAAMVKFEKAWTEYWSRPQFDLIQTVSMIERELRIARILLEKSRSQLGAFKSEVSPLVIEIDFFLKYCKPDEECTETKGDPKYRVSRSVVKGHNVINNDTLATVCNVPDKNPKMAEHIAKLLSEDFSMKVES